MDIRAAAKDVPTQEAAPPDPIQGLASQVAGVLASHWRRGHCCSAEEMLDAYPHLREHPEQAIRVVYEEICQRQLAGHEVYLDEYVRRYPAWKEEIALLLEMHRTLEVRVRPPQFPGRGETLGEYRILSELGAGALGKVYLAEHPFLAGRLVVVKVTPRDGQEHLTLARLQHTHIVPIYAARDFADLNIRQIVMPCLGGAAFHQILHAIRKTPYAERRGANLLEAIPLCATDQRLVWKGRGGSWDFLAAASYPEAIAWIGLCLAEGLQYAHERGLVHLDLKPSNILLTADGVPMLLDFHLARAPVIPDRPLSGVVGGTPGYMPPEQVAAMRAIRWGQTIALPIDERSDLFSLARCLAEAFGATFPVNPDLRRGELRLRLAVVPRGLREILARCMEPDPKHRYQKAADLADDFRRHLTHQPLRHARSGGIRERFRKWRRRNPHGLLLAFATFAALFGTAALGNKLRRDWSHRDAEATAALARGREQFDRGDYSRAVETLAQGVARADRGPGHEEVGAALRDRLRQARRAEGAENLHRFVDQARFLYGDEHLPVGTRQKLATQCREAWDGREQLLDPSAELPEPVETQLRADLLDAVILWADSHARSKADGETAAREALEGLREAETVFGPSAALWHQTQSLRRQLGEVPEPLKRAPTPRTSWERYVLARWFVADGRTDEATRELDRAIADDPRGFWPWFWKGLCAYRARQFEDAASAFTVCTALAPSSAECYHNRALARAALGQVERAIGDAEKALTLNPQLTPARELLQKLRSAHSAGL